MDGPVKTSRPRSAKSGQPKPADLLPAPWRTRQDHSQELAQDYVEIIADLIDTTREAATGRSRDGPALSLDFPDGRRPQAGGGVPEAARGGAGFPEVLRRPRG